MSSNSSTTKKKEKVNAGYFGEKKRAGLFHQETFRVSERKFSLDEINSSFVKTWRQIPCKRFPGRHLWLIPIILAT
jgi:hypothetical protein